MSKNIKSERIVIISVSPGTGKTSIIHVLAENSTYDRAVHIHVDDFWQCICKGYIHPWLDNSGDQNKIVVESVAASTKRFSKNGYAVFVDGTVGPWFLRPWIKMAKNGADVRYILLRPDEETTVLRAAARRQREFFPLDTENIRDLWNSFSNLGKYESHVVDTTGQTVEESAAIIQKMLDEGNFCIVGHDDLGVP